MISLFAPLEWVIMVTYAYLMKRLPSSTIRLVALLVFVAAIVGIVFGQLNVYTDITSITKPIDRDNFVAALLLVENAVAIALCYRVILRSSHS